MKCTKTPQTIRRQGRTRVDWKLVSRATVLSAMGAISLNAVAAKLPIANDAGSPERTTPDPDSKGKIQRIFEIPAGDLPEALAVYTRITGVTVHSTVPGDGLVGFRTKGIQGTFPNEQALEKLLDGTGLKAKFEGDKIEIAVRDSQRVDVNANIASVSMQQFSQPLVDTAQTVNVVPQYILSEQGDTSLRDSLRNVPGVSIAAGEGGSQGDSLTIRGFNARNDIYLDGLRDFGSYYRDSFDYSAVDVLEGPASVEFGRGSTGGIVNQETKQPELSRRFLATGGQFGTNAMRRGTLDFNQPIEAIPGGTAARLNVVAEETGFAGRDVTDTKRFGIAPSLAFGLNKHTRLNLNYLHEGEADIPDYGLPYFGAGYAHVPTHTYYGLANSNYLQTTPDIFTARIERDLGLHVTVRNVFRWANYPRFFRITEPQVNSVGTVVYSNADGKNAYEGPDTQIAIQCAIATTAAASCYPFNTPLSQVMVKRNQINGGSTEDVLWDQLSATVSFQVFHIANNAVVLLEGGRERSDPNRPAFTLPYTTLLNPNPDDPFNPTVATPGVTTHVASLSYGIDFLDTMQLTRWLQISGGVRFDYFSTTSSSPINTGTTPVTAATAAERLDKEPDYRAAVVVKPTDAGSIYFDWGTSFNPAAESLSLSANNATSAPEYNQTFEVGAKWNFMHEKLNVNGSVFRTEKLNARETDPTNSNNVENAGNQLVRGVQIGALGHISPSFDLILGYAYLDGYVEKSILNASPFVAVNTLLIAANDPRANTSPFYINPANYPLANVPKNSANLWVTHKLFYRMSGGFGGNYISARRASSTALVGVYDDQALHDPGAVPFVAKAIPSYVVFSAMLRRSFGEHFEAQVNVANLANRFFIDQPHPGHLVPGEARNAQFGVNYKF